MMAQAKEIIEKNFASCAGVAELAYEFGLCKEYFIRSFKACYGITPGNYLIDIKLAHAELLLRTTRHSTNAICGLCGYSDAGYFCRVFRKKYDMSPQEYRQKMKEANVSDLPSDNYDSVSDDEMYL